MVLEINPTWDSSHRYAHPSDATQVRSPRYTLQILACLNIPVATRQISLLFKSRHCRNFATMRTSLLCQLNCWINVPITYHTLRFCNLRYCTKIAIFYNCRYCANVAIVQMCHWQHVAWTPEILPWDLLAFNRFSLQVPLPQAFCRYWSLYERVARLEPMSLKGQGHEIKTGYKWYGMMGLG